MINVVTQEVVYSVSEGEKNKEGKIVTDNENDCGGDKSCRKSYIFKYLVTIICPPLALFLHMGASGWFHVIVCIIFTVYFYYFLVLFTHYFML